MTPETLITNFLSNKAYFAKYSNKVYGLTGTLGSRITKNMLKEVYGVDFVTIPRYKNRQFQETELVLSNSKVEWQNAVTESVLKEAKKGRSVLVICESIGNANLLEKQLNSI